MAKPGGFLHRLWREEEGPTAADYALWAATIVTGLAVGSFLLL